MKTLQVGLIFSNISNINFLSDIYILDYDLIIINLNVLTLQFSEFLKAGQQFNTYANHEKFIKLLESKKKSVDEFYKHGGSVILIVDTFPDFQYQYRTPQNTIQSFTTAVLRIFCQDNIDYTSQSGSIMENDPIVQPLVENCTFEYKAIYHNVTGRQILWTKKIKETTAFSYTFGKGVFITLPGFKYKNNSTAAAENSKNVLFNDLIELVNKLKEYDSLKEVIEPEWIADYYIGKEIMERTKLNEISSEIEKLQTEVNTRQLSLKYYSDIKSLLYLDGLPLELAVKRYLEKMGFSVEQPEGYDVDMIAQYKDFVSVIEIKGLKGSGAKNNVRQLENWVNNYSMTKNEEAKGLLIINTFKTLPIEERTALSFPPDMVNFSIQRNHCLILTLDLVNLYIDFEENLITIDEIALLLNACVGVLKYVPRFK